MDDQTPFNANRVELRVHEPTNLCHSALAAGDEVYYTDPDRYYVSDNGIYIVEEVLFGEVDGCDPEILPTTLVVIRSVATGDVEGGGPLESVIKMVTQQASTSDLDIGFATKIVRGIDSALLLVMQAVTTALPDFRRFDWGEYVANGFNVNGNIVAINFTMMLGFVIVLTVTSYFLLKTREMAA